MKNIKFWFIGLSRIGQATVISVVVLILLGGIFTVSAMSSPPTSNTDQDQQKESSSQPTLKTTTKKEPVITTKEETKTESIPYQKQIVESDDLPRGQTQIQTYGVNGVKTITYTITLVDGKETNRTSIEAATTKPVDQVTVVGTYVEPAPSCDPNYSGCVPIASDVDCGGGSGNGPAYVYGAVRVIGTDIYDLDRDGDGWGCE